MYKKAWWTCKVIVLPCQAIALFNTFLSPLHLYILFIIYDTLWCVRNRIFSVQIELLLLRASETFFDSSVVPSFLLGKLAERTGQLWRNNSNHVRTHKKNSGETVRRLGTIIPFALPGRPLCMEPWDLPFLKNVPGLSICTSVGQLGIQLCAPKQWENLESANMAAWCLFPSEKTIVQLIFFSKPKLVT